MSIDKDVFLNDIGKELLEENVAIFAGAGMSAGAGFVNWADLLRPIALELELDVDKEHDLVALAQYHCNSNSSNRSQLNQRLIEEFSRSAHETENHRILCRLPIKTYWTTNYDKLIENSLVNIGKIPDVKYTRAHLVTTKPKRSAIVYKMHGDVDHPNDAVLTKDDYEKYHVKMDQYLSALKGDLISKTFIFIGFSFTDPNLDYILSRVRVSYENNSRRHYCFIKRIQQNINELDVDFEYRKRKQNFFINDLARFNVKSILVNEYSEITDTLKALEWRYKSKTLFISGSAHEFNSWGEKICQKFIHDLSYELVSNKFKIISGFGLGVGSSVISGALEFIYMKPNDSSQEQLILRPFPQSSNGSIPIPHLWHKYRTDMLSHAGVAIFIFGNKYEGGCVVDADGVRKEYDIARENGLLTIPVGATGSMARVLWQEEVDNINSGAFTVSDEFKNDFLAIGDETKPPEEIIKLIVKIISQA